MEEDFARTIEFQDPLIGRVLQDRYRVLRLIGRGGMGVVYLAEHVLIRRKLALKLLHSQLTASEELVLRFHREARAAAAVGNEHVVEVTDMGRLEDGTYYIVLEYLEGLDLGALVAAEGPLAIPRVLDIGLQICEALADVHAAEIVHRDLKPENIVLIKRGNKADFVKILDFGICKVLSEQPLTATGVALGTPQFMAPEQLEARPEIDARADVYAVGAILFFALTGRTPFATESLPRLLVSIWSEPAPKLSSVRPGAGEALEALIARALEKRPDQRFPDIRALAAELTVLAESVDRKHAWAASSGVRENTVQPAFKAEPSQSQAQPRQRPRWLAVSTVAFSLVALVCWLYSLAAAVLSVPAPHESPPPSAARPSTPVAAQSLQSPEVIAPVQATQPAAPEPARPAAPRRRKPAANTGEPSNSVAPLSAAEPEITPATPAAQEPTPQAPAPRERPLVPEPAEVRRVFQ